MSRPVRPFDLYLTVFTAGMTTLAAEFTASRMLQTVFGSSNLVWANVIGLVLLALTGGYFLGGRLADRRPEPGRFFALAVAGGAATVVCLLLTGAVLRAAAGALLQLQVGVVAGSLLLVASALGVPIVLLGAVTPFAVRLAVRDVAEAGRVSGRLYAVSTWGSLIGTYLPVLVTIPLAGSRATALLFGTLLMAVGTVGAWRHGARPAGLLGLWLAAAAAVALLGPRSAPATVPGTLAARESAYNFVQVVARDGCRLLLLNERVGVHSIYCPDRALPPTALWSVMTTVPYFRPNPTPRPPARLAVIGAAGNTIPRLFTDVYGPLAVDAVEIDPVVAELGRAYFGPPLPNVNLVIGDGRAALGQLPGPYDVIVIDAFRVPYIPWHLTTVEYFTALRARLAPDGALAINVGRVPDDRRLVAALTATLGVVFATVHAVDVPDSLNTILIATAGTAAEPSLTDAPLPPGAPAWFADALAVAAAARVPAPPGDVIFTDDRAPLEPLVDGLVLRYLLREGVTALPGVGAGP